MSTGGSTYGPFLVGAFINSILYGVAVVQCYVYFQSCKSDRRWIKVFVSYLMIFETLNTIFDIGAVYEPLIIRYGAPEVLKSAPIILVTNPITTVMISMPVQLFIAWRVKVVTKSLILPAIVGFFSIAAFVGGITTSALLFRVGFQFSLFQRNDGAVISWLVSSAVADVIITASLVYSLMGKRTGFADTDGSVNRIVRMSVQTGSITSLFALLDLMLFVLLKGKTWNFVWDIPLSKLYSNTVLSTLNARDGRKHSQSTRVVIPLTNGESTGRGHSQARVDDVTTKVFDSGPGGYHHERSSSVVNIGQEYS